MLVACAVLALVGCKGTIMPRLASPGTAGYQRYNALQFDPYPLDDVAPPVAGGRPNEYDRPIPEVKRGQKFTPRRPNLQPIAIPSFAPSAAPVITSTAPDRLALRPTGSRRLINKRLPLSTNDAARAAAHASGSPAVLVH